MNQIFKIFTVVTLRQVLTQLTGKVHSTAQDESQITKRRRVESVIVNTVMNIIENQLKAKSAERAVTGGTLY